MEMYEVSYLVHNWLITYLDNIKQFCMVNDPPSYVKETIYGVPVCYCLHPYPLFMYINDLPLSFQKSTVSIYAGLSMSKLYVRCQSHMWDCLRMLKIQFLELSLVRGCILFIKLERATNRGHKLSWAHACAFVCHHACRIERPVYANDTALSLSSEYCN